MWHSHKQPGNIPTHDTQWLRNSAARTDICFRGRGLVLRQQLITVLCTLLRLPFALLDLLYRPFRGRGHARQKPRRIVVIKPCCLGDLLMTTPLLEVLHQNYPHASITYVAGSWSKVVPEHNAAIEHVIDCGTVGIAGRYRLPAYLALAQRLRHDHFDLAFVLDRSPLLALLPWLAGIPRRVGLDSLGRGFSLTDPVPVSTQLEHQAELYLNLARAINLPVGTALSRPRMHFEPTPAEQAAIQHSTTPLVAVFPGGGSNPGMELTAKRWPLERYRALVQRIVRELEMHVLLIGGKEDVTLNQTLLAGLDVPEDSVHNIAGTTTFGQLAAQLAACTLFIGNDSSPMHLAAAVNIPVIAIFGPTSPQEYGPYPPDDPKHIALWRHPTGNPCFFMGTMRACSHCTCMQAVTVEDVWQAVQRLVGHTQSREVVP